MLFCALHGPTPPRHHTAHARETLDVGMGLTTPMLLLPRRRRLSPLDVAWVAGGSPPWCDGSLWLHSSSSATSMSSSTGTPTTVSYFFTLPSLLCTVMVFGQWVVVSFSFRTMVVISCTSVVLSCCLYRDMVMFWLGSRWWYFGEWIDWLNRVLVGSS
jgi:hypothetical protein